MTPQVAASDSMKVAIVGPAHPHRGGIVHYTASLVQALRTIGTVDVSVHSFYRFFPRLLYKGRQYTGVEAAPLPADLTIRRDFNYWSFFSWRQGVAAMARPDIIHFQYWTPFLAPAFRGILRQAKRQNIRTIATVHNVRPHERRDRALTFLGRKFLRDVDAVIVHSKNLRGQAAETFALDPRKIHVIPQGIYEHLNRGTVRRDAARAHFGFAPEDRVALAFGIIRRYKGLDIALQALAKTPPRHKLLIAGEPWEDWSLYERLIRDLGLETRVVADLRYIDDLDVELYFRAADITIFPYRQFEAQSAAALTALAFDIPIVVSNVGALPDLAPPEMRVPPEDPEALAEVLTRRSAYAPHPGAAASELNWETIAKQTRRLYEEVVE